MIQRWLIERKSFKGATNDACAEFFICLFFYYSLLKTVLILATQVARSCHRISQDLPGKMRESHRILQENTGNTWNMQAVFRSGITRIFSEGILPESTGSYWNLPEKIREIPGRNTASNFLVFSVASRPFPAVRRSPGYNQVSLYVDCRTILDL